MGDSGYLLTSRADQLVVLIVDDEPMALDLIRAILGEDGYFILAAADGEAALQLSRTFPGVIHLVLSDVQMPKLNGLQLRERLQEERPASKVLLMSGQVHLAEDQTFLSKPFSPEVLKERVRQTISAGQGGRGVTRSQSA